jgi:ATP:guanido phosphotransferase, N-terminal domain.
MLRGGAAAPAAAADYPPMGLAPGVMKLEEWIQAGCGDKPYYCEEKGATFPSDTVPDALPDLSNHNNCMTDFFKKNPEMYATLKDRVTRGGVNLAQCIKTGIDNPGHPHIKTVGLTAGDEDCYTVFAELFDPIISDRHNGSGALPAKKKGPGRSDGGRGPGVLNRSSRETPVRHLDV